MAKEQEIKHGLAMAKGILEQKGCGPLPFAKVVGILKKENPEDGRVRDKVLYWLDVFREYSIISSSRDEKGRNIYWVSDEKLLRELEGKYQKDTTTELTLLALCKAI